MNNPAPGEPKIIYVVTTGEYSAYRIRGVFDDEAKAYSFAKQCEDDLDETHIDVEEHPLNQQSGTKEGRGNFDVLMSLNGDVIKVTTSRTNNNYESSAMRSTTIDAYDKDFWATCLARDEKHAIKICADRLAMYLVSKQENDDGKL